MRYPKGHKAKTRRRIVEAARKLFAAKGYAATSIDEIMRACGLTHGGFYAYFDSKSALYHEAIGGAVMRGELLETRGASDDGWIETMFDDYLRAGREADGSCLAFFATDVARSEAAVRAAYTRAFKLIAARIGRRAPAAAETDAAVLSVAAMLIGAAAIARTSDDAALKQRMVASCRKSARQLLAGEPALEFPVYFWMAAPR